MLTGLLSSLWRKISLIALADKDLAFQQTYPTLTFPPPAPDGKGISSLCTRCLTLLSHAITRWGDGSSFESLSLPHSYFTDEPLSSACIICKKTRILFDAARQHVLFENALRALKTVPASEWRLSWVMRAPDPGEVPQLQFPHAELSVDISVKHEAGYGRRIGKFQIHPEQKFDQDGRYGRKDGADYPVIPILDSSNTQQTTDMSEVDLTSTASVPSMALATSWMAECARLHHMCHHKFSDAGTRAWFPDRLIRVERRTFDTAYENWRQIEKVSARIVLKSNPEDFTPHMQDVGVTYCSLSHCWGPPPDPTDAMGGRRDTVLTQDKLRAWQMQLPLATLPKTFQQAVMVCAALGFHHIWIDSLCIMQDSLRDWQEQSAVMGDVYKFAWVNIAALSSNSDYDGFINDRDLSLEFGFQASFAECLGRDVDECNDNNQRNLPASTGGNSPLFNRAWVYQERRLATRTLAFTPYCLYWACDVFSRSEQPEWNWVALGASGLRQTMRSVATDVTKHIRMNHQIEEARKQAAALLGRQLFDQFDREWHGAVTSYTLCKLTKRSDRLIAISSIARELRSAGAFSNKRYVAGLWDVGLTTQLAWITVHGSTTRRRKMVGEEGYAAPSWSWASIEAPVQPRSAYRSDWNTRLLAEVVDVDVDLETDFEFGAVRAGWIRMQGRLNRVKSVHLRDGRLTLTDAATGESLCICSDTVEGCELAAAPASWSKLAWVPLTLKFEFRMVACSCLVLIEVDESVKVADEGRFIRPEETVYRRIGTGDFGRILSMLQQDKLLLTLGAYPDVQLYDKNWKRWAREFERNENWSGEFVII